MKKKWESPKMCIERFAPNEYVSTCLYLACAIPGENPDDNNDGQAPRLFDFTIESWGGLTGISPDNQVHSECGLRGKTTYCEETNRGFWWTNGEINRSVTVSDFRRGGTHDVGKGYVAWKTTDQNGTVYQHYGYAYAVELPNRS